MNVFAYNDYRDWIRDQVEARRRVAASLTYSVLAEATGIQRTFLSRVLAKEAHLSADQLFTVCEYFSLNAEESDFLILLLELSRTSHRSRREHLLRAVVTAQKKNLSSEGHLTAPVVMNTSPLQLQTYFLDPYMQIVHVLLTIERYRKSPESIALAIGIEQKRLEKTLVELCKLQLITKDGRGYRVISEEIHLPKSSPLCAPYLVQQRIKSLDQIQRLPFEKSYAFSATFAADSKAFAQVKAEFLKFLETAKSLSDHAEAEQVFQLNFDLFPWVDGPWVDEPESDQ